MAMISAGYGNAYPETHFGKFVSIISGIIGQSIFSLLLLSFSVYFNMNTREHNIYTTLDSSRLKEKSKFRAAKLISTFLKCFSLYKRKKRDEYKVWKIKA